MDCPKEDGLFREITLQVLFLLQKKHRYTYWKNSTRIILLVLSAIITLVSGWDATQTDKISMTISNFDLSEGHVILILSTLVTLITAVEAFFRYTDKANTYSLMHFEFRALQRRMCYDFEKDPELYKASKDEYFKQYQDILSSQRDLFEDSKS